MVHDEQLPRTDAFYMMHSTLRGTSPNDRRNKSIHRTDAVIVLNSHEAKRCVGGQCRQVNLDMEHGHVHHYR